MITFEPHTDPVQPAVTAGHLLLYGGEVEQLVVNDVERLWLVYQAINNFLVWPQVLEIWAQRSDSSKSSSFSRLESPKNPVPDGEKSAVVFVQAVPVGPVVYLVVGGRVEDKAQGSQVPHQLTVNPELEKKNKLRVNQELGGRDEESSREIEPVSQLEQT